MLNKKERLTNKEFDRFFSLGKRYHSDYFTLIFNPHPTFHGAVVVGKKVSKKAVARNKIRRRVYSALYNVYQDNNLSGVYLILVKPMAAKVAYQDIKQVLSELINGL